MGSGEVAIVALSTMISLKVTFSDGLGGMEWPIRVEKYGLIREDGLPGRAGTWRLLLLLCSLM